MYYENYVMLLKVNERFIVVKICVVVLVMFFFWIFIFIFNCSFFFGILIECLKMFKGRRNSNIVVKFVIIVS